MHTFAFEKLHDLTFLIIWKKTRAAIWLFIHMSRLVNISLISYSSFAFPKICYCYVVIHPSCSRAALWKSSTMKVHCVGLSHTVLDLKDWHSLLGTLCYLLLIPTWSSPHCHASKSSSISLLSQRCFIEEAGLQCSNTNVIMIYRSSESTGFTACWIPFTPRLQIKNGLWNGMM